MKKTIVFVLFLVTFVEIATSDSYNIIGVWKVENQFLNSIDNAYITGNGLSVFVGDKKTKTIELLDFMDNGTAVISISGGQKVNAFYRPEKYGYYLQPQGGKDTEVYVQPIAGNLVLAALTWAFPADSYNRLILILSKR